MKKINLSDIVFREDLYPRFEPSQVNIHRYSESIEQLPPIVLNQNNILIDGFHRWKAHQLIGLNQINCTVIETSSEKELKRLAYQTNSNHGLQLKPEEKKVFAQEMIGEMSVKELCLILSVGESTIKRWTENQRKAQLEQRNRRVVDFYLRATNTQSSLSDLLNIPLQTISDLIKKSEIAQMGDFGKKFKPLLYNIWNLKDGNETNHFGSFPLEFMYNVLHYHTNPLDIVFDPFAGNGTTVDACKDMFRRYYCSDLEVKAGREKDIFNHDITTGLPDNLPKPKMAFLDPPYWKQAEGKYIQHENQLGEMSDLSKFNDSMNELFKNLGSRKTDKIAVVIQPTQFKSKWKWTDHIFDFHNMLSNKYEIEMRYSLPYSTARYNAQMVDASKEVKQSLCRTRDLVVWRLK